jgi:hypothetical protein
MMDHPGRDVFFDKLAAKLGIPKDRLEMGFKEAAKDAIDQGAQTGYLTATQATRLKEKVESGRQDFFQQSWSWAIRRRRRMDLIFTAVANRFGMSASELENQLDADKSLSDLARERGMSEAELRQTVLNAVKPHLDQSVKEGKIAPKFAEYVIHRIEGTEVTPKAA